MTLRMLAAFALFTAPAAAIAQERRVMLTGYDKVRVEGPFEVTVQTGGPTGAVVTGDARAIESVDVRVEDRTLIVLGSAAIASGWPDAKPTLPQIRATAPAIRAATLLGSGRLAIDRMIGQDVSIGVSGSGAIAIGAVQADRLEAILNGATSLAVAGRSARARFATNGANRIDAAGLAVRDLTVQSESAGEASFAASETASVQALGLGAISVAGNAACTVSGPGVVKCGE